MSSGLLERDTEFSGLESAFAKASAGSGCLVAIEGPAGQGKSALVAVARERAAAAGLRVLSARGGELERDFPFGVVRQLFEPLLAAAPPAERDRLLRDAALPAQWALGLDPSTDGRMAKPPSRWCTPWRYWRSRWPSAGPCC
jgi:predicted ATPase